MTRIRRTATVVFVLGIALATLRDDVPARPPIQVGGYQVLAGDFHVHAFVGDGGLAPWTLQRHAARVGLDVIAITNHNQTLAGRIVIGPSIDPTGLTPREVNERAQRWIEDKVAEIAAAKKTA